jgi:hypothetical protein
MSDQLSAGVLPALEIAAFHRASDGSFSSIAPVPAWFRPLVSDATFPFLGHVLEEANQFWASGTPGFQEFGPCADVDETGREFHYKVIAAAAAGRQFLLFQRDPAAGPMQAVLQKAREQALRLQDDARARTLVAQLQKEALAAAGDIHVLAAQLGRRQLSPDESAIVEAITAACDRLRSCVEQTHLAAPRSE